MNRFALSLAIAAASALQVQVDRAQAEDAFPQGGFAIRWLGDSAAGPPTQKAVYQPSAKPASGQAASVVKPPASTPFAPPASAPMVASHTMSVAPADNAPLPTPLPAVTATVRPPVAKAPAVAKPHVRQPEKQPVKKSVEKPVEKPAKHAVASHAAAKKSVVATAAVKPAAATVTADYQAKPPQTATGPTKTPSPTMETTTRIASKSFRAPQAATKSNRTDSSTSIGGRWMIPASTPRDQTLTNVLTDPFNERRPPDWTPVYRAGRMPTVMRNPVRLMSGAPVEAVLAEADAQQVVPVNYAGAACGCGDDGCGTGCCGTDCAVCGSSCGGCGCCGPVWSAGVDALFLWRDAPNQTAELISCNCVANERFSASDFDLDAATAPRFRLYRHSPNGHGVEFTYFNFDSWDNTRHFSGDLNVHGVTLGAGSTAYASYESQLQSLEINYVRDHGCWTKLITGFRWIQVDESATIYGTNGTTTVSRGAHTKNNLYGGHFGFRRLLYDYGGCLTLDSAVRAGVFGNDGERRASNYGVGYLTDSDVSFVGDVEFQANFAISCRCTLTAGYQLLWITGIASAAEQFYANDYINQGQTAFYHGANVGMVYTW